MTVNLGTTPFEVRSGVFGDTQAPFAAAGVKQMSGGKVRLTLTKENGEWRSAGLLGPIIEAGKTYSLEILGRLDVFDPRVCFAVWGRNDQTGEEVDYLEACRWGNANSATVGNVASHDAAGAHPIAKWSARAWDRQPLEFSSNLTRLVALNVEVDRAAVPFFPGMRLKIALWVPKTGPLYSASRDRGPLSIDVRGFAVT